MRNNPDLRRSPRAPLAAVQLLRNRPWGYVLAGMPLVKSMTIGACCWP